MSSHALASRSSALLRRLALSRPASFYPTVRSPARPAPCAWQPARTYSIHADHAAPTLQELNASKLTISRTKEPKQILPPEDLVFGKTFTGQPCFFGLVAVAN
jgi:branched-chain amino acid aminotransferase